jgi:tyrosine-protein kinase Etk/Wzc
MIPSLVEGNQNLINLLDVVKMLLRKKRLIFGAVIITMVIASIVLLLTPDRYTSYASILPTGKGNNLSGLKELVGLGIGTGGADENSSYLFPAILGSNYVRNALIRKEYSFTHKSKQKTITLQQYFGEDNPDLLRRAVRNLIMVEMDDATGVIVLSVETTYPEFSRAVLKQALIELENFNIHKRSSSARENVRYLERELAVKEKELGEAEDRLEEYQKSNRNWAGTSDPTLLKTLSRLQQDITIKLNTYTYLRGQYETARLEEQKDIPIVRVLDEPSLPTTKSGPFRKKNVLLSGIIAFLIACFILIIYDRLTKYGLKFETDFNLPEPLIFKKKPADPIEV